MPKKAHCYDYIITHMQRIANNYIALFMYNIALFLDFLRHTLSNKARFNLFPKKKRIFGDTEDAFFIIRDLP